MQKANQKFNKLIKATGRHQLHQAYMQFINLHHKELVMKKEFEVEIAIFTVKDYTSDDVILDDIVVIFPA